MSSDESGMTMNELEDKMLIMFMEIMASAIPPTVDNEMHRLQRKFIEKYGENAMVSGESLQKSAEAAYERVAYKLGRRAEKMASAWRAGYLAEEMDIEIPPLVPVPVTDG